MTARTGLLLFFLCLQAALPAQAKDTAILTTGQSVEAFKNHELPKELQRKDCDEQIYLANTDFEPLPDGRYETKDKEIFIAEDNCLLMQTGKATLESKHKVEFYKKRHLDGDHAFLDRPKVLVPLPDGIHRLKKTGQIFKVTDGIIDDGGYYSKGQIIYP